MSSVKIEIVGFIRTEPEVRYTADGKKGLSYSVPHENYKGETEWYSCTDWYEKRIDSLGWLAKDMGVFIRGDLNITEKDGKVYRNVRVEEIQVVGGGKKQERDDASKVDAEDVSFL